MEFAPDGRLFVAEQGGNLRVIDSGGNLLGASFVFGVIPGAIEFLRTVAARRRGEAPPAA